MTISNPAMEQLRAAIVRAVRQVCPAWLSAQRDDIAQEACLRVARKLDQAEEGVALGASYLWRAAHSAVMDEIRRRRRHPETPMEDNDGELTSTSPAPDRAQACGELRAAIDDGLGQLEAVEDGFLQAREVSRLDLSAELVVLSACSSARGRVNFGDGVQGLSQAFFQAGARSIVGSLWEVDDRQTSDFMTRFYRRLADGHSKAHALRLAKLDGLRQGPSNWAAFVLIGEPRARVPIRAARYRSDLRMPALFAVGLLIFFVIVMTSRRARPTGRERR